MNNLLIKSILLSFSAVVFANDDDANISKYSENSVEDPDTSTGYIPGHERNPHFLEPDFQNAFIRQIITAQLRNQQHNQEAHIADRQAFFLREMQIDPTLRDEVQALFEELAQHEMGPHAHPSTQALARLIQNTLNAGFATLLNQGLAYLMNRNLPRVQERTNQIVEAFQTHVDQGNILLLQDLRDIHALFERLHHAITLQEHLQPIFNIGLEYLLRAGYQISEAQRVQMVLWLIEDLRTQQIDTVRYQNLIRRFQEYYAWLQPPRSPVLGYDVFGDDNETRIPSPIEFEAGLESPRALSGSGRSSR